MTVVVLMIDLHLRSSRSLKEKRRVIQSLIARIHRRFRVSIIESEFLDLHQRAQLAVAAVHRDGREAQRLLDSIRRLIDLEGEVEVISWDPEILQEMP